MTPGLTLAVLGPKPVEVCQKRARVATRVDTGGKVQYLKDVTDQGSRREAISQQIASLVKYGRDFSSTRARFLTAGRQ